MTNFPMLPQEHLTREIFFAVVIVVVDIFITFVCFQLMPKFLKQHSFVSWKYNTKTPCSYGIITTVNHWQLIKAIFHFMSPRGFFHSF